MGTGREWGGLGTSRIRYGGLLLVLPYKKLLVLPHKKQLVLPYKKQIWGPLVLLPYEKELVLPYKERASQVKVWDPICHHICPSFQKWGNLVFLKYSTSFSEEKKGWKNALYKLKLQKKEAYFWKHANNILQLEILLEQGYCSCGFGHSGTRNPVREGYKIDWLVDMPVERIVTDGLWHALILQFSGQQPRSDPS